MKTPTSSPFNPPALALGAPVAGSLFFFLFLSSCITPTPVEVIILTPDGNEADEVPEVSFVADIKPVLQTHCVGCHNSATEFTSLNLESNDAVLASHKRSPVLYPGEPERSPLFLVTVLPDHFVEVMPADGHRLDEADTWLIYQWIMQGADWPKGDAGRLTPSPSTGGPGDRKESTTRKTAAPDTT